MNFIIKHKQYSKIILANSISRFGDNIDMIAFAWLIYTVTGSAAWSAIIMGVNQGVSIIVQPFVGGIVEKKHKRTIMVVTDLLRFTLIMILCILAYFEHVNEWVLVAFTVLISFIETFRIPAGVSIIPMILGKDDFDEGVSLNNGFSQVSSLIGLLASGILIAAVGSIGAIFIDGLTFLISAILIALVKYEDTSKSMASKASNNIIVAAKDGFSLMIKHRQLLLICIIASLMNACILPFETLKPAYITLYFGSNVTLLSALGVASSLGMITGSFTYKYIAKVEFLQQKERLLSFGGIAIGLFYVSMFWISILKASDITRIIYAVGLTLVYGLFLGVLNSYVQIFFVKNVKQEYLSRIASIANTVVSIGSPIAAAIVAFMASVLVCNQIILIAGIFTVVAFIVLSGMLSRARED